REVQCDEIARSKSRLTELLGRSPESFAYPFGLHTSETVQIVRETGFKRACACMDHAVRQQSEMHRLTRADLGDLDGDAFARKWREAVNW
ncbi:MAG TPA: polysaccharide deacetylase family protein, partial [Tepidisphaeraceae bacterium]|nr:polysaccharide deacetylase family protein [Tepidisphaeraceae bacterium]